MAAKVTYNMSVDDMDKKTKAIYDDLVAGKNKKQIANRYKVNLEEVMTIARRYKTGANTTTPETLIPIKPCYLKIEEPLAPKPSARKSASSKKGTETDMARKNKRKRGKRLTDDEILSILEDLEHTDTSIYKIAKNHGVAQSTVSRIKKEYLPDRGNKPDEENAPVDENVVEEVVIENKEIETAQVIEEEPVVEEKKTEEQILDENVIFRRTGFVETALIKDRHDMPASCGDTYIFDGPMSSSLMFDYDKQERIVEEFINDHISFNDGKADKSLIVYITGLPCASATVIKICHKMKVNLYLMHFNAKTNDYKMQIVWDCFSSDMDVPAPFVNVQGKFEMITLCKCTIDQVLNSSKVYDVVVDESDINNNIIHSEMFIATNIDVAYDIFKSKIIETIDIKDKRHSVFIHDNRVSNGRLSPERTMAKSYNFK
jgi:transposase-like protein